MQGKLIVVDGIDGSGKTTQIAKLLEALAFAEIPTAVFKFPQHGTRTGVLVESYLKGEFDKATDPRAIAILFAVDRFDAVEKMRKSLAEGKVLVVDRYTFANCAHQGGKISNKEERIKFFKWIDTLEFEIFNIPRPDLNIILDASETVAHRNLRKMGKKLDKHELSMDHLEKTRKVYLELAQLLPNTKLVKCTNDGEMLSVEDIHNQIWQLVRRLVLK